MHRILLPGFQLAPFDFFKKYWGEILLYARKPEFD